MRIVSGLLLLFVAIFSAPSWCIAEDRDGNQLLADCEAALTMMDGGGQSLATDKRLGAGYCLGFMQGIGLMNDFYELTPSKGAALFCRPSGADNGQLARIIVKYLRDHPERLHLDEFVLAVAALITAFPCPNKK